MNVESMPTTGEDNLEVNVVHWRLQPLQNSSLYPRGLIFVLPWDNNVVFELRPYTVQSALITIQVVQMETVYGV